jgi:hypothetical protein
LAAGPRSSTCCTGCERLNTNFSTFRSKECRRESTSDAEMSSFSKQSYLQLGDRMWEIRRQSRQSTKLSLQSSELGLPNPHTRSRVCTPSSLVGVGDTLARGRGRGVPIPTRGQTLYFRYIWGQIMEEHGATVRM